MDIQFNGLLLLDKKTGNRKFGSTIKVDKKVVAGVGDIRNPTAMRNVIRQSVDKVIEKDTGINPNLSPSSVALHATKETVLDIARNEYRNAVGKNYESDYPYIPQVGKSKKSLLSAALKVESTIKQLKTKDAKIYKQWLKRYFNKEDLNLFTAHELAEYYRVARDVYNLPKIEAKAKLKYYKGQKRILKGNITKRKKAELDVSEHLERLATYKKKIKTI